LNENFAPRFSGLTQTQATQRLRRDGPNALALEPTHRLRLLVVDVLREPMFLMLIFGASLYLALGQLLDGLVLFACVLIVMGLTLFQSRRTEHALHALRALSTAPVRVIRDGRVRLLPADALVVGDWFWIAEGDRLPADALLRDAAFLSVDESLLTGESQPVRKQPTADTLPMGSAGGEDRPTLFSGTLVVAGRGVCEVIATGAHTAFARIGRTLTSITQTATPLQTETHRVVMILAGIGLAACALVTCVYSMTRGGSLLAWRDGGLAGITMAMSVIPQEFPVVLSVFLALGAWQISKRRVLTRHLPAIEALGSTTVLCVDKTGTLTENQMQVACIQVDAVPVMLSAATSVALSVPLQQLLSVGALATTPESLDPMDQALRNATHAHTDNRWSVGQLEKEYPFRPAQPMVLCVWRSPDGAQQRFAAKGAPEMIARCCGVDDFALQQIQSQVTALAERGLRVLAVAYAERPAQVLSSDITAVKLTWVGLVGFADPLRADVPQAVADCHAAGIRVVMMTGDYPVTATAIAAQAGIVRDRLVVTGADLNVMSDTQLAARIASIAIFARLLPEQKLRIVQALQAQGEVVAMTGDGVNDAPALRAAHIGIAMGQRGTDVAREAASMVLLNDDFSSIVAAIRLGLSTYDNIQKASIFILATHIPIMGLSMLPAFVLHWPLLLLPLHVVFLELIINPSCALIFQTQEEEASVMRRAPRARDARLFSWSMLCFACLQGLSVLGVCVWVFMQVHDTQGAAAARELTFSTLCVAIITLILVNRSWERSAWQMLVTRNTALGWVVGATVAILAVVLLVAPVREVFSFAPLYLGDVLVSWLAGACCLAWVEILKANPRWTRFILPSSPQP